MPAQPAGGSGGANDATVSIADLQDALKEALAAEEAGRPALRVTRATDKVTRAKRDLAQAEGELKAATAAAKGT